MKENSGFCQEVVGRGGILKYMKYCEFQFSSFANSGILDTRVDSFFRFFFEKTLGGCRKDVGRRKYRKDVGRWKSREKNVKFLGFFKFWYFQLLDEI